MAPQKKLIKNKSSLFTGVFAGLFVCLFCTQFIQGLLAKLSGAEEISFEFSRYLFSAQFLLPGDLTSISYIVILTSHILSLIFFSELAVWGLKKTRLGFYRYSLILFLIIISGYMIINIFYGAFSVFVNIDLNNTWLLLSEYLGITGPSKISYMFFVIILLIAYLNLISRRLLKYINM